MSADFDDDEHRARIAHEHPVDVNSSPSSLSSGDHTYFHSHPRRGSKTGSSSSHLLARLISREEEVRDIKATLVATTERLEAESSRANAAERRALDYFHRLRIATENRERAEQDSARLREELKLYKLQLDNAQKEIFRAQDIIDQVSNQRNEAEAEAARARTKARKLQEEKLITLAREEGRRLGYRQGLSMGRRVGYDDGRGGRFTVSPDRLPHYPFSLEMNDDSENVPEPGESSTDEERMGPRPYPAMDSGPPAPTFDAALAPPLPVRVHTPSPEHQPSPSRDPDGPETIHPIPIRPSPIIPAQPISVPIDDGWIPRVDSRTSQIHMPSPHQLQHPIPASPSAPPIEIQDRRGTPHQEPTPVPPPARSRDYAYQTSVPPPSIPRAPSFGSRASTHLSQYDIVNKRPGSSLRNEVYVGRPRSGSQPSRESTSRNEHRDPERRYSSRTEAENIADQWRADIDIVPGPPPRPYTPAAAPPHRVPKFYRPREVVTPTPLGDNDDPRSRTPVPTEPTAGQPHPEDDSNSTRFRPLVEYHRKRVRQRQRPGSGGSGSIPNIIVESPSEPETTMSPSATIAAQPELLSPEAANRPLPQEDTSHHTQPPPPSSRPHSRDHAPAPSSSSSYDVAPPRSGTPYATLPAGFIPYAPPGHTTSSSSGTKSGPEREHRRTYDRAIPTPGPLLLSNRTPTPLPGAPPDRGVGRAGSQGSGGGGYGRARSQSASTSMGRYAGVYEAAPLPPGVMYPAPPVRPQTSHRQYRDRDRDRDRDWDREWEWDGDRERERARERHRDVRDWERERERARDHDRGRDFGRDYERDRRKDQDPDDTGLDEELTRSPAPLQRPISLFDSDSA